MKQKISIFLLVAIFTVILLPSSAFCEAINHKLSGDSYLRKGLTAPAIGEYKQAIATDPTFKAVYFNLAIAYYTNRQVKEAAQSLETLIQLSPGDTEAVYNLACLKLYLGDLNTAEKYFQEAAASAENSRFKPLIENGFNFMARIKKVDPQNQELLFALLRQGVVPALPS